jgi:hypothetical protein
MLNRADMCGWRTASPIPIATFVPGFSPTFSQDLPPSEVETIKQDCIQKRNRALSKRYV